MQQAITWPNVDQIPCSYMASIGLNELINLHQPKQMDKIVTFATE